MRPGPAVIAAGLTKEKEKDRAEKDELGKRFSGKERAPDFHRLAFTPPIYIALPFWRKLPTMRIPYVQ